MAYYNSNYYENDIGEYHWKPYCSSYDVVPHESSITYSDYEFDEPKLIEYYPATYNDACDSFITRSDINYSVSSFSEPKLITYEPYPYDNSSQTQYLISYSTSEFNVPEFVEYDPIPYDGGYDLTLTYGKPLPPSDETCYPPSTVLEPNDMSLGGFSYGSIPSPYGLDDVDDSSAKKGNGRKETDVSEGQGSNGDRVSTLVEPLDSNKGEEREGYTYDDQGQGSNGDQVSTLVEPLDSNQGEEREGYTYYDDYVYPWSGYYNGYGNGRIGGYEYECDKQIVPQTQYEYGSDAMDFCDSIFGYWPCLAKKQYQRSHGNQEVGGEGSKTNPWKGAADYLFGSPLGYGGSRDEGSYFRD